MPARAQYPLARTLWSNEASSLLAMRRPKSLKGVVSLLGQRTANSVDQGASLLRSGAFFDLDKTVIARASAAALSRPLREGGFISRRALLRALLAQLVYLHIGASESRLQHMRDAVLVVTKGWDRESVTQLVEEALEDVIEPIIYQEALDLIANHQQRGDMVVIVSAAPEEIVAPLARRLGADHWIATRASVDEEGRYTGSLERWVYGPFKAEAIESFAQENQVDLPSSYAYSDSVTDLPMLECVGHPVAVNPDRKLAREAAKRDWPVMRFNEPVSLRTHKKVPAWMLRTAAATTASAFLGAGSLVIWRRLGRSRLPQSPKGPARPKIKINRSSVADARQLLRGQPLPRESTASSWAARLAGVPLRSFGR